MPPILFDVCSTGRLYGEKFSQVFMVHIITISEGLMDFNLPAVKSLWDIPWVIGGDFNVTRSGGEGKIAVVGHG